MRTVSAFVLAALAACSVSAQDARETQPPASTQVEEIYVVRSVVESSGVATEFCAEEHIGFGGATYEGQYTFRSTTTRTSDGRMIETNVRTIGSLHICADWRHPDAITYKWYGEGTLGSTPFKGIGECRRGKADFPERGLKAVNCRLDLSGLPSDYVGGVLTSNTMQSRKRQGMETDPPGYTQASIATIRLWRKRDAPFGATAQSKSSSQVEVSKESLVGTWKLVSSTPLTDKGEAANVPIHDSNGLLTYTADGRMIVIMTRQGQKPISTYPPSAEEAAEAFSSLSGAYAGTYTVGGDKVTHHIELAWLRNVVNTDQVRTVKLEGNRLILRGGWVVEGRAPVANTELVWERLKPETVGK